MLVAFCGQGLSRCYLLLLQEEDLLGVLLGRWLLLEEEMGGQDARRHRVVHDAVVEVGVYIRRGVGGDQLGVREKALVALATQTFVLVRFTLVLRLANLERGLTFDFRELQSGFFDFDLIIWGDGRTERPSDLGGG